MDRSDNMLQQTQSKSPKVRTGFVLLIMLIVPIVSAAALAGNQSSVNSENTPELEPQQNFSHAVIAEDITAEWCIYCPTASETLKSIYESGDYKNEFFFVSMITQDAKQETINEDALQRATDYNIPGYPTVVFDGGVEDEVGGQSDETNYRNAIESAGARTVPKIDIELSAFYYSDESMDVGVTVTNFGTEDYSGNLRIYITEIVSRYIDHDGNNYPFGFMDYAINTNLMIGPNEAFEDEVTWKGLEEKDAKGDVFGIPDPSNVMLIATVFNSQPTPVVRPPPYSKNPYVGHFADQSASAFLQEGKADDIAPMVDIIQPHDGDNVKGTIEIKAKATDNNEINKVMFQVGSTEWMEMTASTAEPDIFTGKWDSTSVPDSLLTLNVEAYDLALNVDRESITIQVSNNAGDDTTPPSVSIQAPAENTVVTGIVLINAIVTDDWGVAKVEYSIDSGTGNAMSLSNIQDIYESQWDTRTVTDGVHSLSIFAEDYSSNSNSESIYVTIDNSGSPPKIDNQPPDMVILEPNNDDVISGDTELIVMVTDNKEVSLVEFSIVYETPVWLPLSYSGSDEWAYELDTTNYPDGEYSIFFRALDKAGNEAKETINIEIRNDFYDVTKPVLKPLIPNEGDILSGIVELKFEVKDDTSVLIVEYIIDDSVDWIQMLKTRNNVFESSLDTTKYPDGDHILKVRASDESLNVAETNIAIQISNKGTDDSSRSGLPGFTGMELIIALIIIFAVLGSSFSRVRHSR